MVLFDLSGNRISPYKIEQLIGKNSFKRRVSYKVRENINKNVPFQKEGQSPDDD